MDPNELIQQYLLGNLSQDEVNLLDRELLNDPQLRQQFLLNANIDTSMRDMAIERSIEDAQLPINRTSSDYGLRGLVVAACLGIAASLLLAVGIWRSQVSPAVATLVASENAAWESDLPTSPGSRLSPGSLSLKTGIATISFDSGAELIVEAPATVELISDMRVKLGSGAAVMNVPDSAIGFILETPDGYAVDFGTSFAISVDEGEGKTDFELIEGEIEVHHSKSGESVRLDSVGAMVKVTKESLTSKESNPTNDEIEKETIGEQKIVRIRTNGRCGSAMPRSNKRRKTIKPEYLYVKHSDSGRWDFSSFFSFELSGVDLTKIAKARLRLNLVPSDKGFSSRLPPVNQFAIYGLTNDAKKNWKADTSWEDAPAPEDGELLGKFEIPRSQQRGVFGIETEKLLAFLKKQGSEPVTLILVRETTQIPGTGPSLTHLFASDQNPESVGPQLELSVLRPIRR